MKLKTTVLAAMLAAVLLAGCETSAALNKVHIGMSKMDVQSLLGTPDSTSAQANVEYMTYYLSSEAGYGRDQPYMVRLVNGKVESFGRFAQLFDLYNRPVTNATPGQADFPQLGVASAAASLASAAAPGSPAPAAKPDLVAELEKLKELKDQGALTDDEFQKAKAKLLGQP
jgi:outer membrane protein assembly factor BamE (lipoprotein component of BamABCDE complex)